MKVAGLDVGFAPGGNTSAIGVLENGQILLRRVPNGRNSCQLIVEKGPFDVVAIDGPIVHAAADRQRRRAVEAVFQRGLFQKRCKPGASHVVGTGFDLRNAACDTADWIAESAPHDSESLFPLVRRSKVVEAFPNAFLGVCVDDEQYQQIPKLRRGQKFDWLYDQWKKKNTIQRLKCVPVSMQRVFKDTFDNTYDHEERAALICLLTALAVANGNFTAVGSRLDGWFFLPPWESWANWARTEIRAQIEKHNGEGGNLLLQIGPQLNSYC